MPMDSILNSIKKASGIMEDYHHFDDDLMLHINSVLSVLTQLGVGPSEGFMVTNDRDEWYDFIQDDAKLNLVKTYMQLRVKLLFDPPLTSSVIDAITRTANELEWRIQVAADPIES